MEIAEGGDVDVGEGNAAALEQEDAEILGEGAGKRTSGGSTADNDVVVGVYDAIGDE